MEEVEKVDMEEAEAIISDMNEMVKNGECLSEPQWLFLGDTYPTEEDKQRFLEYIQNN